MKQVSPLSLSPRLACSRLACPRLLIDAAIALAVCTPAVVHADANFLDGALRLSGFGTIAASRTNTDDVVFGTFNDDGATRSRWSPNVDSKLTVQARYQANESWSLTGQWMSRYSELHGYTPEVDWAYARWVPRYDLAVRAGRMAAPFFMASDSREVGYATTPVRPPLDVYGQAPLSRLDGMDVQYTFNVGDTAVTSGAFAGSSSGSTSVLANGADLRVSLKLRNAVGLNMLVALDNGLSVRVGVARAALTTSADGLPAMPDDVHARFRETFYANGEQAFFGDIGLSYDVGNWVATAEYAWLRSATVFPDTRGWLLQGGYRFGRWLPYLGLAEQAVAQVNKANPYAGDLSDPGPPGDLARTFQTGLDGFKSPERTQTIGLRWDPVERLALKWQWDRVRKPAGSSGMLFMASNAERSERFFAAPRHIDVWTVSMDFVF